MTLLRIINRMEEASMAARADDELVLPYDLRQKSRQRVTLRSGRSAGLCLPRGIQLKNGDLLSTDAGLRLRVVAAEEEVSVAEVRSRLQLARIAYHLGNRHVAVQVLEDRLIYRHDHVLDAMVRGLGARVTLDRKPFEPEEGAYHGGAHHHS